MKNYVNFDNFMNSKNYTRDIKFIIERYLVSGWHYSYIYIMEKSKFWMKRRRSLKKTHKLPVVNMIFSIQRQFVKNLFSYFIFIIYVNMFIVSLFLRSVLSNWTFWTPENVYSNSFASFVGISRSAKYVNTLIYGSNSIVYPYGDAHNNSSSWPPTLIW